MRRRSESSRSNTHKKSTDWSANTRKLSKTTLQRFVNSMSRRIRNSQPPSAVSSKSTQARCQNLKKSTQQLWRSSKVQFIRSFPNIWPKKWQLVTFKSNINSNWTKNNKRSKNWNPFYKIANNPSEMKLKKSSENAVRESKILKETTTSKGKITSISFSTWMINEIRSKMSCSAPEKM